MYSLRLFALRGYNGSPAPLVQITNATNRRTKLETHYSSLTVGFIDLYLLGGTDKKKVHYTNETENHNVRDPERDRSENRWRCSRRRPDQITNEIYLFTWRSGEQHRVHG